MQRVHAQRNRLSNQHAKPLLSQKATSYRRRKGNSVNSNICDRDVKGTRRGLGRPIPVICHSDAGHLQGIESEDFKMAKKAKYAALHDFCMGIPYGAVMSVGGLLAVLLGSAKFGAVLGICGAIEIFLSYLSLKRWKQRKPVVWVTLSSLCISSLLAYLSFQLYQLGAYRLLCGPALLISSAMSLFLVYNILAGGNPPPKST